MNSTLRFLVALVLFFNCLHTYGKNQIASWYRIQQVDSIGDSNILNIQYTNAFKKAENIIITSDDSRYQKFTEVLSHIGECKEFAVAGDEECLNYYYASEFFISTNLDKVVYKDSLNFNK